MRRRLVALPIGLLLLLTLSAPGGASPGAATGWIGPSDDAGEVVVSSRHMTVRQAADWTTFEYADALPGAQQRTHSGHRTADDGCLFSGSRTVDPSEGEVSEEREVANNLRSCTMVTEVGTRPRSAQDDEGRQAGVSTATETATPAVRGPGLDDSVSALATRTAWHRTRYRDPVWITVTRATTNVTYTYNGSCVTASSGHSTNYYWFGASGWSKISSYTTASRTCSGATTTSDSHFRNSTFCVGQPTTYTRYVPNRIRGNANGSYTATWTATKSGGCSWLSFQSHTGLG